MPALGWWTPCRPVGCCPSAERPAASWAPVLPPPERRSRSAAPLACASSRSPARNAVIAARMRAASAPSPAPRILAASSPALRAPATETVATGTPAGIWTMDSRESMPSRYFRGTGTPMTGSEVTEASMPGRCAAPPAPAMITRRPRSSALRPYSTISSGIRCADTTSTSHTTPNSSSAVTAASITGQSESEPMTTPTTGAPAPPAACRPGCSCCLLLTHSVTTPWM